MAKSKDEKKEDKYERDPKLGQEFTNLDKKGSRKCDKPK